MTTMYKFQISDAEDRRIAAQGIGEIVARIQSMGQFTMRVNDDWVSKEKRKLIEQGVDFYMEELLRIGFDIQFDDEEEED